MRYFSGFAVALFTALVSAELSADDAGGFIRVRVDTNDVVACEMPFVPYGFGTPSSFISGPFAGDFGKEADKLYVLPKDSGKYTNAVFSSSDGWLDPSTGEPSQMTVAQGDNVVFAPGLFGINEPFPFFI